MTNEQIQKNEDDAMESAWRALKPELDPSKWTTGESFTYFGFFFWGWEARRQYDSDQIDALKAEVERLNKQVEHLLNLDPFTQTRLLPTGDLTPSTAIDTALKEQK